MGQVPLVREEGIIGHGRQGDAVVSFHAVHVRQTDELGGGGVQCGGLDQKGGDLGRGLKGMEPGADGGGDCCGIVPLFIDKLKQSYISGNVSAALLVSHNSTDTNWFHSLSETLAAICFPARRIKFYRGDHVAGPTNGQMFIYLGDDIAAFWREFHPVGYVVIPA